MQFRISRPVYAVIVLVVIPAIILAALRAVDAGTLTANSGGFWIAAGVAILFIVASAARIADMHVGYFRASFWLLLLTLFFPFVGVISIPLFLFARTAPRGESTRDMTRNELTIEYN